MIIELAAAVAVGAAIGFWVGRSQTQPSPHVDRLQAKQTADLQSAQVARMLGRHRDALVELEQATAALRHELETQAEATLGSLPATRVTSSRLLRPEESSGQPRDYADGATGMLRVKK